MDATYHHVRNKASGEIDENVTDDIHASLAVVCEAVRLGLKEVDGLEEDIVRMLPSIVLPGELFSDESDLCIRGRRLVHHLQVAIVTREDKVGVRGVVGGEARALRALKRFFGGWPVPNDLEGVARHRTVPVVLVSGAVFGKVLAQCGRRHKREESESVVV